MYLKNEKVTKLIVIASSFVLLIIFIFFNGANFKQNLLDSPLPCYISLTTNTKALFFNYFFFIFFIRYEMIKVQTNTVMK
jgi:hypothetical protein